MREIISQSIDMILTDPPFGTTPNSWDQVIPFHELWDEYKRIIKPSGAIVLFSQLPFASDLIQSNKSWFRYEWIWKKTLPVGFLNAHKMPMRTHENILVFYDSLPTYNPQFTYKEPYSATRSTPTT